MVKQRKRMGDIRQNEHYISSMNETVCVWLKEGEYNKRG